MTGQAKRLLAEISRVVEITTRARDRADALNEADTNAAFIDPILGVLGWEVRDLFTFLQQYRRRPQDNAVDCALLVMRSPVLFVETKALNKDLSDYKWIWARLDRRTEGAAWRDCMSLPGTTSVQPRTEWI